MNTRRVKFIGGPAHGSWHNVPDGPDQWDVSVFKGSPTFIHPPKDLEAPVEFEHHTYRRHHIRRGNDQFSDAVFFAPVQWSDWHAVLFLIESAGASRDVVDTPELAAAMERKMGIETLHCQETISGLEMVQAGPERILHRVAAKFSRMFADKLMESNLMLFRKENEPAKDEITIRAKIEVCTPRK